MPDPQSGRPSLTEIFGGATTAPAPTEAAPAGRPSLADIFGGGQSAEAPQAQPEPAAPGAGDFARRAEMPQQGLIGDLMGVLDRAGTLMVGGEENRRKIAETIRGAPEEDVTGLRGTAANVVDAAISMGPAILASRIGAKTGLAKAAVKGGEFTGEFVRPTGEKVPLREQVGKGYREVVPFAPAAVQKAVAPVAAPLVGAASDILSKVAESKPAQWARDRVSEVFGSEPGSPELRELYKMEKQLRGAERGNEQAQARDYVVLSDMRKKITDTTGLTGRELEDAIGLAAEQGPYPGTPGAELAAKYPALGNLGHYLRYRDIVGREATKGSTEAAILGEAQMREAGAAAAEGLTAKEVELRAAGPKRSISLEHESSTELPTGQPKHRYAILDDSGTPIGHLTLLVHDGDRGVIDYVTAGKGAGALGPRLVADLGEELAALHPELKTIEGNRISGIRKRVGKGNQWATIDLSKVRERQAARFEEAITANLLKANAELTKDVPLSKLTLSHQSRLLTKEGSKFFGVESGFGTGGKRIREVDFTLPDVGAREAWKELPIAEINRLAEKGELPGHEGKKSGGPVFESNPLDASVATGLFNGRLLERANHLLKVKRKFGKPLSSFHGEDVGLALAEAKRQGFERLDLPERSAFADIMSPAARARRSGVKPSSVGALDEAVLPSSVVRRLKGTQLWLDPDSYLNKAFMPLRMWDAYQGAWSEFTLTPFMFPATTVRNGLQEHGSTISSGTGFDSMRLAHTLIQDVDKPARETLRHAMENPTLNEAAQEFNQRADPFFGSPEAKTILGGAHDEAEARFRSREKQGIGPTDHGTFVIWDDHPETGHPVMTEVTLPELRNKAIEQGQLGLQRLRQIRYGLSREEEMGGEASALRYMRSAFGDPNEELSLQTKLHRIPQAWVARYFEELPRVAQFLEGVVKRGLTPAESARWTNWYHLDMKRPLTQIERSVFRRAMPFYRWSRFNIPASLRIAFLQPWIPMLTLKMYQVLSSGTAEKKLTAKNFPIWMRQQGGFFPMSVKDDKDGHPIIYWTTPQGTFSTMDLLQWFGSPELAYKQTVSSLSPIVHELNDMIADRDLRTGAPLDGDTMWMGMQMPARLAAILDTWRPLNRLNRWTTDSKDRPNLGLAGNVYNQVAPFSIYPTDLSQTQAANARQVKAVQQEGKAAASRERFRLMGKGARAEEIKATYKQRMKELAETLRELRGK